MSKIHRAVFVSGLFLGTIWAVYVIDATLSLGLAAYGIHPRTLQGLGGIVFAPFLHANLSHVIANSPALFVLLILAFMVDFFSAVGTMVVIVAIGGLGSWLFGSPDSVHIGASGLVFGLFGYLIFRGWFRKDMKSTLAAVVVFFLYGGLFFSLFSVTPEISWTGHAFGFLGGVLSAKIMNFG